MEQYSGAGTLKDRFIALDIYYQYVYNVFDSISQ